MRVSEEPNVEHLRMKARVLEDENERLIRRLAKLMRELLELRGMAPEQIELNLPGLVAQAAQGSSDTTSSGSERRPRDDRADTDGAQRDKPPQTGHGPTEQLKLEVVEEDVDLDDADKVCPCCGEPLEPWSGKDDQCDVIDVIERKWIVRRYRQKKYRCRCGGTVQTAQPPPKVIKGGRYSTDVAIAAAADKYFDHLPLDRQVHRARRQGVELTSQALWDQTCALAELLAPLGERIKQHILSQLVIGVDQSPFKYVKKGGHEKWQAWQISCPEAVYFEILEAKSAEVGARLLGDYAGTVIADGAKEFETLSRRGAFGIANCWSHARRQVLKADVEAPGQVAEFLDLVGNLYEIERRAVRGPPADGDRRRGYRHLQDLEELRELRATESTQVIADIKEWMLVQKCIPGGLLRKKLAYVSRRWTALTRFLEDPRIPLDNNRTEAGYVGVAIGRRNYIGARSERGMQVAAIFYSLRESSRVCGGDPLAYLRYATAAVLNADQPELPHTWVLCERG